MCCLNFSVALSSAKLLLSKFPLLSPAFISLWKSNFSLNAKISTTHAENIVIFWNNPDRLELWYVVISLKSWKRLREFKGKIDWSGAVFKLELLSKSSYRVNVLYSAYVNAWNSQIFVVCMRLLVGLWFIKVLEIFSALRANCVL